MKQLLHWGPTNSRRHRFVNPWGSKPLFSVIIEQVPVSEWLRYKQLVSKRNVLVELSGKFLYLYVLLTVYLNIMIAFFTNLMHKFFILIHLLYSSTCFEHYYAHLQEDNCISTASGIANLLGSLFSTQVTSGRESSRNLCTEQSPKKSDDTRCCVNTIVLLKMSTVALETCTGM